MEGVELRALKSLSCCVVEESTHWPVSPGSHENMASKHKGTTATGQARLESLCLPVPGRAVAPRQETQTQTDTHRQAHTQAQTQTQTRSVLKVHTGAFLSDTQPHTTHTSHNATVIEEREKSDRDLR